MAKQKEVTGWTGWVGFAAFMMLLSGLFGIFDGLTAIVKNDFYVVTKNYLINVNISTWGWVHLIVSIIVILAALAVLNGRVWGRAVGVIMALLSALAYMAFIPYYPIWSILIIVVDILIIYALIVHGDELGE